jgi:hypothetical protein
LTVAIWSIPLLFVVIWRLTKASIGIRDLVFLGLLGLIFLSTSSAHSSALTQRWASSTFWRALQNRRAVFVRRLRQARRLSQPHGSDEQKFGPKQQIPHEEQSYQ